jgi:serine/threonine protein kinase
MIAGKPAEEPAEKEPANATPVTGQPSGVVHENHAEGSQGPAVSYSDRLRPGKLFASFELERELESGSTGAVWLAHDYSVGRQVDQVALKFLPDSVVSDKTALEELKNEIRRRITLKHPNILRVYNLVENKGRVALQMEYLEGQSLSRLRLTKPNQTFEVRELGKWIHGLCEALEYVHQDTGRIDGEILPDSLVVDAGGNLKLKDVGITKCITESMSRLIALQDPGEMLPYKSPQRAAGEEPAITDDLYSLGANLYELLTSKPPFYAGDIGVQISEKVPPSMTERRAELGRGGEAIPKNWEETVAACLAKDPAQRPKSASEVKDRLKTATSQSDIPATSTLESAVNRNAKKTQFSFRKPPTRNPWLAMAGVILILAVGSSIVFFSWRYLTESDFGRIVLNTIVPVRRPSPTPAVLPSPSESTEKENPRSEITLSPKVRSTLTPEVSPTASPEMSQTPFPEASLTPSPEASPTPSAQETAAPNERQSTSSSPTPFSQHEVDATKEDVIKRINALPGITAEKKASLIEKMQKARSMERLTVIPFDAGRTTLRRAAADELVKSFSRPEMRDKVSDPTTVLVVAGYADIGGRADKNLRISQERAENVTKILKEQAKLLNAMQTIGMGGTELLDSNRPDQNRAVEVWAVVPL